MFVSLTTPNGTPVMIVVNQVVAIVEVEDGPLLSDGAKQAIGSRSEFSFVLTTGNYQDGAILVEGSVAQVAKVIEDAGHIVEEPEPMPSIFG